jgi:hypothetical protein
MKVKTTMTKRLRKLVILAALPLALAATARADAFRITLDTSPLSGTQTLGFGLTDSNTASNILTLTQFTFGGGSATGGTADCTFLGTSGLGCSGDLPSGVTLQDLDPFAAFSQQFTPGSSLSFILTTTNNFNAGTPDTFAMYLCDSGVSVCYSDDAATGAMLFVDLAGGTLTPSSFTTFGATEQNLDAPVVTDAVPEPGALLVLIIGLAGMFAVKSRRVRKLGSIS